MKDHPILGKFHGEPAIPAPSPRDQLIDAYWAGEMGDVEFTEIALRLGMDLTEVGQVLMDVREEDGTL